MKISDVKCPYCGVERGVRCRTESGKRARAYHTDRAKFWTKTFLSGENTKKSPPDVPEKRKLTLRCLSRTEDEVTFQIAEQTHRGDDFTPSGYTFKRSGGGLDIVSAVDPDFRPLDCFYVRGSRTKDDNRPVIVSREQWKEIVTAVRDYNDTFGSGDEDAVIYPDSRVVPDFYLRRGRAEKKEDAVPAEDFTSIANTAIEIHETEKELSVGVGSIVIEIKNAESWSVRKR